MSGAQINFLDEIIVDNFAGGGGASTGIELATGRVVDIAVNHDPDAILMHKTNHPHTRHFQASVWDVDPVEEFQTWGPVRKGKPVKKLVGQAFHKWLEQLKNLGYAVEWRELVAADYGAPTTRKRFFLIARHDGRPIVWPKPTHAPADSPEVKSGKKKPWRSAAEIIDWSLPCPSIFDSRAEIKEKYGLSAQRPLRPNTMRRVARGVDKFVIKSADPFLVIVNHAGDFRGQEMSGPLQTVTAKHGYGVASPVMAPLTVTNTTNSVGAAAGAPVHTVTTATTASMVKLKGTNLGGPATETVQTITAGGGHHGVITTEVVKATPGADLRNWPKIRAALNEYCGYTLEDNEVILFLIGGAWYFMADIGLRMLTPRELYRANGFPDDYKIDKDYTGKEYGKTKQVARCGNAVPPPFATALVRANLPEWCGTTITTMAQLERLVAV